MDKTKIIDLLKKYGYNTVSFQSLMSGLTYFESSKGIDGFIPYIKIGKVYLCAGDPICDDAHMYDLVNDFRKNCRQEKAYCCFLSASELFKQKLEIMGFANIKIGEEGIFHLSSFSLQGPEMKDLRKSVNQARHKGVVIKQVVPSDKKIFTQILRLNKEWLTTRKVKGFSFLLTLNPTENITEKYVFVAECQKKVVGYITCVPIYKRNGIYFEDLIRSKSAPNGTNHLLVTEAIEFLKKQNYELATLGTSPLGNIQKSDDQEFKRINKITEYAYEHLNGFYNFKGLHSFKESFNPSSRENKYFSFYPPIFKPRLIFAIMKAYNPNGVKDMLLSKLKKTFVKEK